MLRIACLSRNGKHGSVFETLAEINGVEPFANITVTLNAIAKGHSNERIDELLAWNFAAASI